MAIKIDSGLVTYPILNERDEEIATLVIDKNDSTIIERLVELRERAIEIEQELAEIGTNDSEAMTAEEVTEAMAVYNEAARKMVEETEKIFGDGIVHEIYSQNYALNPNFVPSIDALSQIYEQFIPLLQEIFKAEDKKPKYSPAKKGAKTPKTRKEVIAELKNE